MTLSIGVVVPTYNRAGFLPETLDAILGQTRPPDAIVVVDDGSTDETPSVLARYAPRVKALRITNSGELVARNTGVAALATDLVAFCDSDDLWRPGFLAAMEALWRAEPGTRAAYGDFVIIRVGQWQSEGKFVQVSAGFWDGLRTLRAEIGVFDTASARRYFATVRELLALLPADERAGKLPSNMPSRPRRQHANSPANLLLPDASSSYRPAPAPRSAALHSVPRPGLSGVTAGCHYHCQHDVRRRARRCIKK